MNVEYEAMIIGGMPLDQVLIHTDLVETLENNKTYLNDKYGNRCEIGLDCDGNFSWLVSYGDYSWYILYKILSSFNKVKLAFVYEEDYYNPNNDWETRSRIDTDTILKEFKDYDWNKQQVN